MSGRDSSTFASKQIPDASPPPRLDSQATSTAPIDAKALANELSTLNELFEHPHRYGKKPGTVHNLFALLAPQTREPRVGTCEEFSVGNDVSSVVRASQVRRMESTPLGIKDDVEPVN